jgi:VanZ family protein
LNFLRLLKNNFYFAIAATFFITMIVLASFGDFEKQLVWLFNDKLLHLFAYSFLSLFIYLGLGGHLLSRLALTFFIIAGLGAVDELIQYMFPARDPSFDDWLVDCLGGIGTVGILAVIQSFFFPPETEDLERDGD